jgi:hypothetical protein
MSKTAQQDFVCAMVNAIKDGYVSPLKIIAQAKSMAAMLKDFCDNKDVKDAVLREYEQYYGNARSGVEGNVEYARREVGVKYDYSASADWQAADAKCKDADAARKAIEERFKTASKACPYVDISTGEEHHACPRRSETQVVVTIK